MDDEALAALRRSSTSTDLVIPAWRSLEGLAGTIRPTRRVRGFRRQRPRPSGSKRQRDRRPATSASGAASCRRGALLRDHSGVTAVITGGPPRPWALHRRGRSAWRCRAPLGRELRRSRAADYLRPPLTTVRSPSPGWAPPAVDALVDQLDRPVTRGDVVVETRARWSPTPRPTPGDRGDAERSAPDRDGGGARCRAPRGARDLDGSRETVLVRVVDEEGRVGIGEADAPAEAVRELVAWTTRTAGAAGSPGFCSRPRPVRARRRSTTSSTRRPIYHGRRGLGIHALSAVDVALHDLVGKQLDRPAYQLLGGARRDAITPVRDDLPGRSRAARRRAAWSDLGRRCEIALALGFRAVKIEVLFDDLVTDRELVELRSTRAARSGADTPMMLDFGYRWHDWRDALWTLSRVEDCDVYFAEATLQHDDLEGHARLAEHVEIRVAGAEFAATVHECREWLERGGSTCCSRTSTAAAGSPRSGASPSSRRYHGGARGPHGWKTGSPRRPHRHFPGRHAERAVGRAFPSCAYAYALRADSWRPEPEVGTAASALPDAPGLGHRARPGGARSSPAARSRSPAGRWRCSRPSGCCRRCRRRPGRARRTRRRCRARRSSGRRAAPGRAG